MGTTTGDPVPPNNTEVRVVEGACLEYMPTSERVSVALEARAAENRTDAILDVTCWEISRTTEAQKTFEL